MTLILRGRRFGFPLEEIRQWLEIYDTAGTEAQMRAWIAPADRQLVELTRQRDELDAHHRRPEASCATKPRDVARLNALRIPQFGTASGVIRGNDLALAPGSPCAEFRRHDV